MPIPLYTIKDLFVSVGKKETLAIKQFDIHRGACYVFEGRMGSGKSTLLDILYSRKKVILGEILYENSNIYKLSKREYIDQIAYVPQNFYPPRGDVKNYIYKTIGRYSHIKDAGKIMGEISRKMKLNSLLDRKIKTLSPGEVRWVVLAASIASDTKVLFIDEIEMHLGKSDLKNLVNILHRKINYDGVTLIASTQNKDVLSRIASVTITMENGKIISVRSYGKKKDKFKKTKKK